MNVPLTDFGRTHLIGVGGAGMSAIAALLVARGLDVTGSDAREGAALAGLRAAGVTVWVGHDAAHVDGASTVVVSTAVRESNPELTAARARGLRVLHRSQALAALMAGRRSIAVAGAHGKTTTSAMTAVALAAAGLDPSFAIGGTVLYELPAGASATGNAAPAGPLGGAHDGRGEVFVAEADESDGSFLAYAPTIAVVTNVEPDHLDHYGTRAAFERAFEEFAARIVDGGCLVACADDAGAGRLVGAARAPLAARGAQVLTYGEDPGADVVVSDYRSTAGAGSTCVLRTAHPLLRGPGSGLGADVVLEVRLTLAVPGRHNALDAAAAWTAVRLVGVDPDAAAAGLAAFRGTGRRFEDRGSAAGVRVVDDYAHHPTEVAALLAAARPVAAGGRVLALFQPHLYSRTRAFAAEFAAALDLADVVVLTDIYGAREDPDPAVTSALITAQVPTRGKATFVPDRIAAARTIAERARPGDLILTVGAGDVTELAQVVLDTLTAAEGSTR
ncbi:UDP-N-acetylmuramate--L-alanine ligase [Pengzhenrongella frigida]|uniref:UDP-N-acetylmuramate--L-alanine ligase n=1 Tax=Pengzhenrongella frigida TaxID=1259133 RepID=A0A4Q5N2W2_9MICO|nr:UDP-N-acetylmuramate--L-alanine ligase [Cellulomonas sp. HLT2-17]RYV52490.1 UDP-N-acetylmuramate--L-alanine ligase [Cellulomonas sp. HLT2-17]